ncbi:MAG: mycofactocin-coupled SDR family oxidoreductase [Nocardioides sp.]|uniref:mycofactocin-coupled SDR family oxidoreductase n=1 Tax=Nocardioides sp. TaxID=35761 RepID=UPI0039E67973
MGKLDGKVAIITGAGRGQGRSHAITLASKGARIVAADICAPVETVSYDVASRDDLDETARLVGEAGGEVTTVVADVRSTSDMDRMAHVALEEFGRIDILLANAGIHTIRPTTYEITDEEWETMLAVNLTGAFKAARAVIPSMIEAGNGGSIVFTSSVDGLRASPSWGHYGAAKAGLQSLTKTLSFELARQNIRVNAVNPTGVNSPMAEALFDQVPQVMGRWAYGSDRANLMDVPLIEVQDISNAILYLVSDEARYVTGITLPVDAGYTTKH